MYATKYHRPSSVDEAVAALAGADDGKLLAGGMTLLPTMKQRLASPSDVVDLRHIADLSGVAVDGSFVTIGATTTHAAVAGDAALRSACSAVCELAGGIGDPHVRNMGTIGGSIANNDPAADYPAAIMALNATVHTNQRSIDADDFFTGMFETALEDNEVISSVTFDAPEKAGYAKFDNPASRYAMAGVFVARKVDGSVRVGVTGAGQGGVFRLTALEDALVSNWSADAAAGVSVDAEAMLSDIHGDGAYRANLVKVMAERAISAAG
ncbi:MAG: xanthine dehydrogenase family protein subunit M [Pseudomonadota bacterium]